MALMPMFWGRDAILDVESENFFKRFGLSGHSNMGETDAEGGLQQLQALRRRSRRLELVRGSQAMEREMIRLPKERI